MSDTIDQEKDKGMFMGLVSMLATSALQQMGKIVNPATGKSEMNLDMASLTIDMLGMLQRRTEGNLDKDEQNMFTDTLSSLQLTFVETKKDEESKKDESPAEETDKVEEKTEEVKEGAAPESTDNAETKDEIKGDTDIPGHKDPKFHKSYE